MKKTILNFLYRISGRLRRRRMARLQAHFEMDEATRILDVGGSGDWNWRQFGIRSAVTVLNLHPAGNDSHSTFVLGDACDMSMFSDGEFDLVFSNSVIEHLKCRKDQERMAFEIQRVGNAYWVQTPNRHFPVEPHLCFPFVQYMPIKWRLLMAKYWPFSFQKLRGKSALDDAQAILLSGSELQALFPSSTLIRERFFLLTKSLVVFKKKSRTLDECE